MTSHISKYNTIDLYSKSAYEKTNMVRKIKASMKKVSSESNEYKEYKRILKAIKEGSNGDN